MVILTLTVYQLIITVRGLPEKISKYLFKSIDEKINEVANNVETIKKDLNI